MSDTSATTIIKTGDENDDRAIAQGDGYYIDAENVKRFIAAGDPIPPGVEVVAGSATSPGQAGDAPQGDDKPERGQGQKAGKPAEDKAAKSPAESK